MWKYSLNLILLFFTFNLFAQRDVNSLSIRGYQLTTKSIEGFRHVNSIHSREFQRFNDFGVNNHLGINPSIGSDTLLLNGGKVIIGKIVYHKNGKVIIKAKNSEGYTITATFQEDQIKQVIYGPEYYARKRRNQNRYDIASIGLGFGLDYGGIGVNLSVFPVTYVGVFAGLGFNFSDQAGYNIGIKSRIPLTDQNTFYVLGMYGYNTVNEVDSFSRLYEINYDFTVGFGFDFFGKDQPNAFSIGMLFPFRGDVSPEVLEELGSFKSIAITIGYKVAIAYN